MIRQVDSSLLDEWEKMRDPNYQRAEAKEARPPGAEEAETGHHPDTKAFTAAIRNRIFTFLRGLVNRGFRAAYRHLASLRRRTDSRGRQSGCASAWKPTTSSTQRLCLDPNARNARHTYVIPSEDKKTWRVQQMLVDPEGHNDWVAEFEVDLAESRKSAEPILKLRRLGSLIGATGPLTKLPPSGLPVHDKTG